MPEVTDPRLLEILNKPAGQKPAQGMPQPVLSLPNAGKAQERQNDQIRTDIAVESNARTNADRNLSNAQSLRKEFDMLPEVRSYKVASQQLAQALSTGDGPQGDLALTYAFAKAMDPDSVVREAEQGMVADSQPWLQASAEKIKKQFGMDGAGSYTPEARAAIRQQIIRAVAARNKQYVQRRDDFSELAKRNNIDPFEVVGNHAGSVYLDQFRKYDEQRRKQGANVGGVGGQDAPTENPFDGLPAKQNDIPEQVGGGEGLVGSVSYDPNEWDAQGNYIGPKSGELGTTTDEMKRAAEYVAFLQAKLKAQGYVTEGEQAALDLFAQGRLFGFGDEIKGAISGVGAALQGKDPNQAYQLERDLTRMRLEQDRNNTGWMGTLAELAGGAATGRPFKGMAGGAAGEGAAMGALAGFGYGNGAADSLTGAGIGAATGGALGAGGQKVADALAGRAAARVQNGAAMPSSAADAYAQGQKFGMDLSIGDVRGRGAGMIERSLDTQPAAANTMNAARARLTGQMETAVDNVAGTFGPETSFRGMGEAAQAGVKNWRSRFDNVSEKLYNAIPIKPETQASLGNTIGALEDLTNKITSNPKLAGMLTDRRLAGYLDALKGKVAQVPTGVVDMQGNPITREVVEGGALSWNDLKQLRSRIGEEIGEQILGEGTLKSDLRRLYGALSSDMEATAKAQGPSAYRAFKTANDTYKAGQEKLERVWTSLLGKDGDRTPEAAAGFIQRITKDGKGSSDLRQIAELRRTLKPDEWGQVSNGLIRLMGQPANSPGREFNPQTFTRVFADMSPEAKNLLFGGSNKALRQNLEEFAQVIERVAKNDSTRNVSGTAYGVGSLLTSGTGATIGASVLGPVLGPIVGIGVANSGAYNLGKLWTNPSFVRWATGYTKMAAGAARNGGLINGTAFQNQMQALSRVASADSVIAADALGLQRQLIAAFGGPTRLAAEPQGQSGQAPAGTTKTGPGNR